MTDLKRQASKLYEAVEAGQIVVFWGADPARAPGGASNTVLAYDKDVPEKGGVVVMLSGTPGNMTAEEFKKAPKAGKAP
jgi:hypothetical protein